MKKKNKYSKKISGAKLTPRQINFLDDRKEKHLKSYSETIRSALDLYIKELKWEKEKVL